MPFFAWFSSSSLFPLCLRGFLLFRCHEALTPPRIGPRCFCLCCCSVRHPRKTIKLDHWTRGADKQWTCYWTCRKEPIRGIRVLGYSIWTTANWRFEICGTCQVCGQCFSQWDFICEYSLPPLPENTANSLVGLLLSRQTL